MKAGIPFTADVFNDTDHAEIVHWHGQMISATAGGAIEEGSPPVPPHGHRRYGFRPGPAGTPWYHSHAFARKNLHRGLCSGQFGFVCIEPKDDPGPIRSRGLSCEVPVGTVLQRRDGGNGRGPHRLPPTTVWKSGTGPSHSTIELSDMGNRFGFMRLREYA